MVGWKNRFDAVCNARKPADPAWDKARSIMELIRADLELSMTIGLVSGVNVELLMTVD